MKNFLLLPIALGIILIAGCNANEPTSKQNYLEANFKNPPVDARPKALWDWVNGNFSLTQITNELEDIKKKGMGGFDIWDVGTFVYGTDIRLSGPAFLSDQSIQAIAHTIREADRLGLEIGLITSSSWNSGGTWISPEHTAMGLYSTSTIASPQQNIYVLPFPENITRRRPGRNAIEIERDPKTNRPSFYKEVAVLAMRAQEDSILSKNDIIDVSEYLNGDQLTWTVPQGNWIIMRYVCLPTGQPLAVPSPKSIALQMDHFSASAQRENLEFIFKRLEGELGDLRSHPSFKYLYVDSYEVNSGIWSPELVTFFKELHGYNMVPYLPALKGFTIENKDITLRFIEDYKKALSEMIIQNHYALGEQICRDYGIVYAAEAGGPGPPVHNVPFEDLKALGSVSYLRGEFWNRHNALERLQIIKGIASASHIYDKKYVEAEAFTSTRVWQEGPAELKPLADRAMCEGLNRFVYHTFPHTPPESGKPGWVYNFGTLINTTRAWWPLSASFHEYLGRCSYMLQEGDFVADVAYYYGAKVPNFASPAIKIPGLSHKSYDYDVLNTEILIRDLKVVDGKLVLPSGQEYKILVLAPDSKMDVDALNKVLHLVRDGAVVLGNKPTSVFGLSDLEERQKELDKLVVELWGDEVVSERKIGKGKIFTDKTPDQLLSSLGYGFDFNYKGREGDSLQFIHRKFQDEDYYFVRNVNPTPASVNISFRVTGKKPEIWNAESGEIFDYPIYQDNGTSISLPMHLQGYESFFVVFKNQDLNHISEMTKAGESVFSNPSMLLSPLQMKENSFTAEEGNYQTKMNNNQSKKFIQKNTSQLIEGEWILKFPHGWGAPQVDTIPELKSWHQFENGTRYFSGVGTYLSSFSFDEHPSDQVMLDLGEVYEIARIYLNGHDLGSKWHAPYLYDITNVVKSGPNYLTVEVANLMNNQLIGDAMVPDQFKRTHTNIDKGPTPWSMPWNEVSLKPSGMIGPVYITSYTKN